MKEVRFVRGPTGTGKSTWSREFQREHGRERCVRVSADDAFYQGGEYRFDVQRLQDAHNQCFEKYCRAVLDPSVDFVIVDNTNATERDMFPYLILANVLGLKVLVHEFRYKGRADEVEFCLHHSRHNVPRSAIERMLSNWHELEPDFFHNARDWYR